MNNQSSRLFVIILTLFFSICLTVAPLPIAAAQAAPHWTLLTLLYWSITVPQKVGIGTAWATGIFLDVLTNDLIGHHALIFSLAIFFGQALYSRIKNHHPWQQASLLIIFLFIIQVADFWITKMSHNDITLLFWLPVITSALFWPFCFIILRSTRDKYHVY